MKKLNFIALIMPFFVAIIMLLPFSTTAQGSDGFFRANESENYQNRDTSISSNMNLGGVQAEDPAAPLGNGLLVMVAAGAGYIALKRRNSKKARKSRMTLVPCIAALLMLITLTNCKKKEIITSNNTDESLFITLNASYCNDKTVYTPNGEGGGIFTWNSAKTEYIHVYGDGHPARLGFLSGQGNDDVSKTFTGSLNTEPYDNEKLYFLYIGEIDHTPDGNEGTLKNFTDQDGTLNSLTKYHIAIDTIPYSGSNTFNATLDMTMAIAYFDLRGFGNSGDVVRIYGDDVYTNMEFSFQYPNGKIDKQTKGCIKTTIQDGGNYIALVPTTNQQTKIKFASDTKIGEIVFNGGIKQGRYYTKNGQGDPLPITAVDPSSNVPGGAVSGVFTVASGKTVYFSKGNLQYQASSQDWRFAEHQWDIVGDDNENISATYDGWIDLFGWGTSGYHKNGDVCNKYFYPYSTDNGYTPVTGIPGYGPTYNGNNNPYTQTDLNLIGTSVEYDWGVHNAIRYGNSDSDMDVPGTWRTLTSTEWQYVFNTRTTSSGTRWAMACVNSVNGVILLPDDWNNSYYELYNVNTGASYSSNTITEDQWNNNFGVHKAVFLPHECYRDGTVIQTSGSYRINYYWSSTYGSKTDSKAVQIYDNGTTYGITHNKSTSRRYGCSVRLVHDIN